MLIQKNKKQRATKTEKIPLFLVLHQKLLRQTEQHNKELTSKFYQRAYLFTEQLQNRTLMSFQHAIY